MGKRVEPLRNPKRRARPTWARRLFRSAIHHLSCHFIYERRRTRITRAAGFGLIVPPTVFHPRWFLLSEFFATFIAELELTGKRVADVGTGSGILALAAARAGAVSVVTIDINPNSARAAADNAQRNGAADKVSAVCSNLFAVLAPAQCSTLSSLVPLVSRPAARPC